MKGFPSTLSIFSLAEILQLILEISATYRLVSYLLADNWLFCRLRAQCMISKSNVKSVPWDGVFVVIYFKTMYNKTVIRFDFCDIRNNQGLGKRYQPSRISRLITLSDTLIIPDITKASSNNCLVFCYLNHGLSKITLFALSFSFQVFMYILSSILEGLTALGKNSRNLSCFMTLQVQGNSFLRNLL